MVAAIGSWCARRRWIVVALWIAALAGVTSAGILAGGQPDASFAVPGSNAQTGADIAQRAFPASDSGQLAGQIVIWGDAGAMKSAASRTAVDKALRDVKTLPGVVSVGDPFAPGGSISPDGSTVMAPLSYDLPPEKVTAATLHHLEDALAPVRDAGLHVAYAGSPATQAENPPTHISEGLGLLAAVIVLLVTFMAVLAMLAPLVSAIVGLLLGMALITLSASFLQITSIAPTLATMIGLGVGIDYAVFIVSRHREALRTGASVEEAIHDALASSGRAVLVAGSTVAIALLGLFISGIPAVSMLGVAAAIAVVTAVLAALTLLPAVLAFFGRRVLRPRDRSARSLGAAEEEQVAAGFWGAWARYVGGHPVPFLVLGVALMLTLTYPMLSMNFGQVDAGSDPPGSTTRIAYDRMAQAFGAGINGPVELVLSPYADDGGAARVAATLQKDADVAAVAPPQINAKRKVVLVTVIPRSSPTAARTEALVGRLPREVRAVTGAQVDVYATGLTAGMIDLSDRIVARLPYLIAAVLLLSFLLLVVEFRSLLVPLKAVVMNVLSVSAAYGAIVAIFQWGWGASWIGVPETVQIVAYVPMMMFAILFGLSMDYEVFLISRIREAHRSGLPTVQSVEVGLSHTARVITAAALVMITVFLAFVLVDNVVVKMFGIGLATAVLVDSTVVRLVLVPSTMALLGDANWWLPGWLGRILPRERAA